MATYLKNGVNYSWADITLVLFGVPVVGITKLEYSRKQEKTNNYGWGSEPVSRGYGRIEYSGSIELYKDEWNRIISAAPNKDVLQIPMFDIQVIYGSTIHAVLPDVDILRNVEFLEDNTTANEGDTRLMVTIPIIIAGIDHQA